MSILQIGQYSRQYQGSPGCRKNVNPFLTNDEKQSIQRQKQRNQNKYRQILQDQMKTNLRQKQAQRKKQIQEDMKHQKLFYEKIKVYRQVDSRKSGRKNIIGGSFTRSVQNNAPVYETNIFKKSKQLTLPPLQSTSVNSHRKRNYQQSIIQSNYFQPQNSYLKYKSLMQIGSRLRGQSMTGSMLLDDQIQDLKNQDLSRIGKRNFQKTYYKPQKKYKELKNQLKEKEIEIYQLLEKSSSMIQSTKSPLRQVKKRLSTQPIYIPQQFQDDDDGRTLLLRSRLKTQFQPHIFDQEDEFYRVPLKSSISSIDHQSSHMMSMGQESYTVPSQRNDEMMRIEEENPENQQNNPNDQQNDEQYENYE